MIADAFGVALRLGLRYSASPFGARCYLAASELPANAQRNMGNFDRRKSRKMRRRRSQLKVKARSRKRAEAVAAERKQAKR
jgi:hypothetical protein